MRNRTALIQDFFANITPGGWSTKFNDPDETAWDLPCREHGTLLQSAVGFGIHMQWLHRGRARLLLPAALWLAPPAPSKRIGAEQLPSIDGTFEKSMPGSVLLPRPSASSSRLHGGSHEQSWSPAELHWGETSTVVAHRVPQYSLRIHQRGCQSAPD